MYTHICVYTKDIYMVHISYIYIYVCYIIHAPYIYIYSLYHMCIYIMSQKLMELYPFYIYDGPILTGSLFKHPSISLCVFPFPKSISPNGSQ